ncbi:nephrin-like [Arctopsyche grandis]|uniref:nephrin-like n=1 Tax=Arctopsyche grandis TaxID=121162 RepID=UPI00406D925B
MRVRPTKISLSGVERHAVQGSKVSLECLVQGARPAANLTWYNGSTTIDPQFVTEIANVQADGTYDTQSSLTFVATRYENGQAFRCEAENIVSREESEKPLHATRLLEILYPPIVSVRPENITVNETADIYLFCEYEANPASLTSVTWVQNGRDLNLAAEPWRYEDGTTEQQALVIRNSSSRDLGSFSCRLANSVGSATSPTNKPEVKIWMEPPGPVIESERQNVTLHCEVVNGNPPILTRARWFLDGDLLKQLPDCNTTAEQDESSTDAEDMCEDIDPSRLLLQQASRGFHGNYSCEGENSAGWGPTSESAELLAYYEPGPATLTYSPTRVIKGHSVVLTCRVQELGRPAASRYQWYRGARAIADVVTPTWTIDPVSLETAANFTCRAVNEAGMGEAATVLLEVLAPPAFINNFPPYTGALYNSDSINISCRVECSPPCTVQWLKDGRPISPSAPYYRVDSPIPPDTRTNDFESIHSQLVWNITQWPGGVLDRNRDNANYTCRSSDNGVGSAVTSSTVFGVEYPPENITVSNKVISVVENNIPDKVHCYSKGNPDPLYIWRLSNTTNQQTNSKTSTMSADSLHQRFKDGILSKRNSLVLDRPVQRWESGDLICEAKNKHGSATTTTQLNVMYKPECGITQTEIEGYQVLVCTANANPKEVSFTWRLKNENDSFGAAEQVRQRGYQSILKLDPAAQAFRTYLCVASNQVGSSIPCERDVAAGSLPWWRRWEQEPLLLAGAAALLLLIMLLLCIPLICYCRRRNSDKWGAGSGASGIVGAPDERDTYQNLTFHGLQHVPPTKNTNLQQQQYTQNSNFLQNNSIKNKGKKNFQIPTQDHHSFCYFQPTQSDNQCGNNVQSLPEHGSYDPQFYTKTLDRSREKGRQKSNRMKKSESLREKLSCVGSHSTDSFDRRNCRSNLNDFLASTQEAPASYFQHFLKSNHNTNPQRNYPPSYSYTMSSLTQGRHSKDAIKNSKEAKNQKRLVYADLALSNHNMKFKNTVHSNRQLYGNFALTEHETIDGSLSNNQRYGEVVSCNNNQRKNNPNSRNSEQGSLKYNEIDV